MPDPTGRISHIPEMHRGVAWKQPCRAATTAAITIATALNAGDSLDGVTLAAGDRVLVKDQVDPTQNGIYVAGATPTRAFDMDQDATTDVPASEVVGAFVYVSEGSLNRETVWRSTNTGTPTLGTTPLFFTQFGAIVGSGVLYFDDTASVGAYQTLTFTADTATGEEIDTGTVNSGSGEVLIEGYLTGSGIPGLTVMPSGQWAFHTFRKVDNITGVTRLVFKVYKYAVDTTETLLFTVTSDEIDDTVVNSSAVIYATSQPDFVVASTDRILVKVYCTTTSVADRTVSFYHNGTTHYSHLATPFASPGGGPGSLALDDLTDVTITAPSDGEVLTYDNGTSEWVNAAPTGGVDELAELIDVNLDYLDDGDFLTYDEASGLWITTGAPSGTVPDGTDPGDLLVWDGAAWDILPIGTDDDVLTADSGETLGVKWAAATGGGSVHITVGLIPGMWADSYAGFTASASESYATSAAYNAFTLPHGVINAFPFAGWLDNGSALPQWLRIQMPDAVAATAYAIMPWWVDNYPGRAPKTWTFEGSNDGSSWTTLDTQTNFTAWTGSQDFHAFTFSNTTAYSYYQLNVSANGGNAYLGVGGLQVYADVAVSQ